MSPKKPKRSAFDQPIPTGPATMAPQDAVVLPPVLGPAGTAGLRLAVEKKRPRTWEREHQYGQGYSLKGVRPDINLWLLNTAEALSVRVDEVAVYALRYSMNLVESGELKVKLSVNPRGALMTLFPSGYDQSGGDDVQVAILQLAVKNKAAKGKGKTGKSKAKERVSEEWKSKPVTWTHFDKTLKARIVEYCRDRVPQGEFVTFLVERARADHQAGLLKFNPQPKATSDKQAG
jgi:hypothetical protein